MKHKLCIALGVLLLLLAASLQLSNEARNARAAHAAVLLRTQLLTRTEPDLDEEEQCGCIGVLSIPKLELELPIQSGWDEERLKTAPCRFSGSLEEGNLVLMAHNYRSHFGPIRRLEPGDEVLFTDLHGVTTRFLVASTTTVDPGDIGAVTGSGYELTLFTCTYGARTRTVIYCHIEP